MRVLFFWPDLTGYMGDSWRALAKRADLRILIGGTGMDRNLTTEAVMENLDWRRIDAGNAIEETLAFHPDVIVQVGWHDEIPRRIAFAKCLDRIPKLLVMDMPWRRSIRCFAARFVLGRFIRRFRGVLVHGAPNARYAKWLGFADENIHRHCILGVDLARFRLAKGQSFPSREGFLFIGRRSPEKDLDTLMAAYGIYRNRGGAWPLSIPEWIEPQDVPRMMHEYACLVLPSKWEPWGVVVVEAKVAGMKVIVSDQVNARRDVACDGVFRVGNAFELAERMLEVEKGGAAATGAVESLGYWSCESWADRVMTVCEKLKQHDGQRG